MEPEISSPFSQQPPLDPILSQINPIHAIPSYLRSFSILSSYIRLCFQATSFLHVSLSDTCMNFFPPLAWHTLRPSEPQVICSDKNSKVQLRKLLVRADSVDSDSTIISRLLPYQYYIITFHHETTPLSRVIDELLPLLISTDKRLQDSLYVLWCHHFNKNLSRNG
jgi:hypothetical protein